MLKDKKDGSIFIGSIMKWSVFLEIKCKIYVVQMNNLLFFVYRAINRGAVDRDGRIGQGDMLMEINGISLEHMDPCDAVSLLRSEVMKKR